MYVLVVCAAVASPVARGADDGAQLQLVVDTPTAGSSLGSEDGHLFVSGRALRVAGSGKEASVRRFDVLVVIDTSASTRAPSGADVDGDGELGRMPLSRILPFIPYLFSLASSDPGDSILAAELEATRTLVDQLDPETTRVAVMAFAGDNYSAEPDARVIVPLTTDYERVERALSELFQAGPSGMTNLSYALDLAAKELGGPASAPTGSPGAERVVLFMTDGLPTLPEWNAPSENARLALAAARRSAERRIRVDTFAIGEIAGDRASVVEEIARTTGGRHTPVRHPRDLIATFRGIRLADVAQLSLRNATTSSPAAFAHLGPDGTFSGIVPVRDGTNLLEVRAISSDGEAARVTVEVWLEAGAPTLPLTDRFRERQTQLLEGRLAALREHLAELESQNRENALEQLQREIETVRARRRQLRKRVDVHVAEEPPSEP